MCYDTGGGDGDWDEILESFNIRLGDLPKINRATPPFAELVKKRDDPKIRRFLHLIEFIYHDTGNPFIDTTCCQPVELFEWTEENLEKLKTDYAAVADFYASMDSFDEDIERRGILQSRVCRPQSCPLRCKGCWVTQLHSEDAGELVPVTRLAAELLDPNFERNGVTVLGGDPFAQPDGLLALVRELREQGCPHIVCYSGYMHEALREKAIKQTSIGTVLDEIDILIDGAYVESLSSSAGLWTGSGNQRVIDLAAVRRSN